MRTLPCTFAILVACTFSGLAACGRPDFSVVDEISGPVIDDPTLIEQFRQSSNPYIRDAVQTMFDANARNEADLTYLLELVRVAAGDRTQWPDLLAAASLRLQRDEVALRSLLADLDGRSGDDRGTPALRTSIGKLLGTSVYSGILDDADVLLARHGTDFLGGSLGGFVPKNNGITVLKTALIYLLATELGRATFDDLGDVSERVGLLYPAELPAVVDPTPHASLTLFAMSPTPRLWIPNAGYIYGGNYVGTQVRGVDCSAFVARVTESTVRLSTAVIEYAWRELQGDDFSVDDPDGTIRDAMRGYGLDTAKQEYEAIVASSASDLQGGDLVTWRAPQGLPHRSGHVVMALEAAPSYPDDRFYSIEATRMDDKSLEGLFIRALRRLPEDVDLYVLRRRVH